MEPSQQNRLILPNKHSHIAHFLAAAEQIEQALDALLPPPDTRLHQAMRYAVLGGGKRFRGSLIMEVASLFACPIEQALHLAAACELVHAYSLVHDDLPAMDDAPLRRGKPSCHTQFGESTAILVGDALLPLAYQILILPATHPDPTNRLSLIRCLCEAIGSEGMVYGQMIDLGNEKDITNLEDVYFMEHLKTGKFIAICCRMAALLGGASEEEQQALFDYGSHLGRAFQMVDDILDVQGNVHEMGKLAGNDEGKKNFISLIGMNETKKLAHEFTEKAIRSLQIFEDRSLSLKEAALYNLNRLS